VNPRHVTPADWQSRAVSMVRHARDVETHTRTVGEVLDGIRTDAGKSTVEKVRAIVATEGRDAAKPTKETLPAVTFSGTFTRRANGTLASSLRLAVSGLRQAGRPAERSPRRRGSRPAHRRLFRSPSGDGLKVLVCIPADAQTHRAAYETAAAHFAGMGLTADTAPRAPASLCFVSYDPQLFTREDPAPFAVEAAHRRRTNASPPRRRRGELTPWADFAERTTWGDILGPHGWTQGATKADGNTEWTRPGKDEGTSATTKGEDGPMFVFSSNAAPLPPNEGISKSLCLRPAEPRGRHEGRRPRASCCWVWWQTDTATEIRKRHRRNPRAALGYRAREVDHHRSAPQGRRRRGGVVA
jgi:hypothetical protein